MSLENNIKRIADALDKIADSMLKAEQQQTAPAAAPAAPAAPAAAPAAPAPAAPETTVMTAENLNNILVAEFKRLGSRDKIDEVMKQQGITSVQGLTGEQQQKLITDIKALQP